jgi:FkbM family methyltransferase
MKLEGGFWFPASDKHCYKAALSEYSSVDVAVEFVKQKKLCIQAGGNCGVWAKYLATQFEEVWTFEPDLENYLCLIRNVPNNVFRFFAGLGHKRMTAGIDRIADNCGAHQINMNGGDVQILAIDDLELSACDLIVLDIEGMEPLALEGAKKTIERLTPVLMIEDRDISRRYGFRQGWPEQKIPGYRLAAKTARDVIMVPE